MSDEIIVQPTGYEVYKVRPNGERWPVFRVQWRCGDDWVVIHAGAVYRFTNNDWVGGMSSFGDNPSYRDACYRPLEVCLDKARELVREASGGN